MAGIMDKFKTVGNDGAALTLAAVAVVAGVGAANQAGMFDRLPVKLPGTGSRSQGSRKSHGSYNDDDQWWGFGQEYETFGSSNQGSRASAYNEFVGERIAQLTDQGRSSKDAMQIAAQEWNAMKGQGW
jgi:hypothetical protein